MAHPSVDLASMFLALVRASQMQAEGTIITLEEMNSLLRAATPDLRDANRFFAYVADNFGLKPSLTVEGYEMRALDSKDMLAPPREYNFDTSPFVDRPARAVGGDFLPLVRQDRFGMVFAHRVRWFAHPFRQQIMIPLRFESFLGDRITDTSRVYVDLPVVFRNDPETLRTIRVSYNAFEAVLFADSGRNYVRLHRTRSGAQTQTEVKPTTPVDAHLYGKAELLYHSQYLPYFDTVSQFVLGQSLHDLRVAASALAVADFLLSRR